MWRSSSLPWRSADRLRAIQPEVSGSEIQSRRAGDAALGIRLEVVVGI